jgi:hypothetical protein
MEAVMEITQERLKELEACEELLMQILNDQTGMETEYEELYPQLYACAMGDTSLVKSESEL